MIVIQQGASEAETAQPEKTPQQELGETALLACQNLVAIFRELPAFPARAVDAIRQHDPAGSASWPLVTMLYTQLFLAIGWGADRMLHRWERPHFAYLFNPVPQSRAKKISYVPFRALMQSLAVFLQCLVAVLLVYAINDGADHARATTLIIIAGVGAVRPASVFFQNLFVPYEPGHRLLNLTDADAKNLQRQIVSVIAVIAVAFCVCMWMDALGLHFKAHTLSLVVSVGLCRRC